MRAATAIASLSLATATCMTVEPIDLRSRSIAIEACGPIPSIEGAGSFGEVIRGNEYQCSLESELDTQEASLNRLRRWTICVVTVL